MGIEAKNDNGKYLRFFFKLQMFHISIRSKINLILLISILRKKLSWDNPVEVLFSNLKYKQHNVPNQ